MFPAIRLGFIVAPTWALSSLVAAKNATDWHCSVPTQMAVGEFIRDGHLTRHIRRVRRIYRDRRDCLIGLFERSCGDALAIVPSFYGMHLAAVARGGIDCEAVSEALARRGIMIHSLARYFLGPATRSGFVFGYAAAEVNSLRIAVAALARGIDFQSRT
jgi:GntR family transcriptional regulator/MocR family aminotransferase